MTKTPNLYDATDLELIERARQGDEDAYRELERRYRPVVFDVIYGVVRQREQAEDLTQEALVKLFGALDSNGPERHPSAWIRRMANNTALDYVRRKRPDSTRSHLTTTPGRLNLRARPVRLPWDTPTAGHDLNEFLTALKRALRRLKPQHRRCFVLYHFEHRSYEDIARIMNVRKGTVGTYLHRAREQLKRMLQPPPVPHTPTK
jgi:RNA polymerase sigma-70 factor (ECF subfamily)